MVPDFCIETGTGSGVLFEYDISGFRRPYERFGFGIVLGKIVMDGSLQFGHACEDTPADALASDFCKEALNQIQPGRRCWNEMQFETRMLRKPGLDLFVLWVV